MQSETDAQLLRTYAANGSEAAFGELVRRHADLVYSAALRQVGDPETARDMTQSVFTDLARKAGSLPADVVLIGWLYRGTRYAALNELRSERRRHQRERLAMELLQPANEPAVEWGHIRPAIDEAMASLNDQDRDVVLLRYFKNQSLATVGAALGISEDAAQKRVTRALDKLRDVLATHGIKSAVGGVTAAITANAVQAAPAGLAGTVTAGALSAKLAPSGFGLAQTLSGLKTAATAGLIVAVTGLSTLHYQLRQELREARSTVQRLTTELQRLRAENQQLTASQIDPADLERLRRQAEDVHRLRAETSRMRRELDEARTKATTTFQRGTTNAAPVPVAETQTQVTLESKFVEVPDSVLKKIGAGWLASGKASVNGVLTPDQFRQLFDALSKQDGVDILGGPRLGTLSGRQGRVSVTQPVFVVTDPQTLATTNDNVGCLVDLTPLVSPDRSSIELTAVAEVRSVYETVNFRGQQVQEVRPLKASAFKRLSDGQTLIIRQAWGDADKRALVKEELPATVAEDEHAASVRARVAVAGPRSLLVFVTAQLVDGELKPLHAAKP